MRNLIVLFAILGVLSGCQDVIEVDAPSEEPRLTVNALIPIDESAATTTAVVRVGLTSSFFGDLAPTELEQITIQNLDYQSTGPLDENFIVLLETGPGIYEGSKQTSFFTEGELSLNIEHQGQRYIAQTRYAPTVPIDSLEQGDGTLFEGNETEILVSFVDAPDREDFYLFDFGFSEYLVAEDTFYPGQPFQFSFFYDDRVQPGQELEIKILGATEAFYNYMNQLIFQGNSGDQGPFQTPAATVRGNLINVTDIDNIDSFDNVSDSNNFALGLFAVSQQFSKTITVE